MARIPRISTEEAKQKYQAADKSGTWKKILPTFGKQFSFHAMDVIDAALLVVRKEIALSNTEDRKAVMPESFVFIYKDVPVTFDPFNPRGVDAMKEAYHEARRVRELEFIKQGE